MKYIGCAYYPEVWPRERWKHDAAMMKEAGFNLIRLGEFAWSVMEPEEGRYDFAWLHDIVDLLYANGIQTMLCTPTAAPPPWVTQLYPETLLFNTSKPPAAVDIRRRYCPSSQQYRTLGDRITARMAREFASHPGIVAWQLDNEIAIGENPACECESCRSQFNQWLKVRYRTLTNLNQAWGNRFWSGEFSDWKQIVPPFHRNSARLDWVRFQSHLFGSLTTGQTAILKQHNPSWTITTNSWISLDCNLNMGDIIEPLDVVSYDCYVNYHGHIQVCRAAWDLYRNLKKRPFWIAETGAWNCITTGQDANAALRCWAWEFFARGAETLLYFRWRQSVMGEEEHPAILPWSGEPSDAYFRIQKIAEEFKFLREELQSLPLPESRTAILFSPAVSMLYHERHSAKYCNAVIVADDLLNQLALTPDILSTDNLPDLKNYKLIVVPQLEQVNETIAAKLKEFVFNGGILLAMGRLALTDGNGKHLLNTAPCGLIDLFGIAINERCDIHAAPRYRPVEYEVSQTSETVPVSVTAEWNGLETKCFEYMEKAIPESGCEVIGRFTSGNFAGQPFMTTKRCGNGMAVYQTTIAGESSLRQILSYLAEKADLNHHPGLPREVTVIRRGWLRFYINNSSMAHEIELLEPGDVITGETNGSKSILHPYGITIIKICDC